MIPKRFFTTGRCYTRTNAIFDNWWPQPPSAIWFDLFLQNTGLSNKIKSPLFFSSVFGERKRLSSAKSSIKVFYTGENVHSARFWPYFDNMLFDCSFQLCLGFDYINISKYIRFPIWILTLFDASLNKATIKQTCHELMYPKISGQNKFACLIASHDPNGIRKNMSQHLTRFGRIDCPGKFMHNDDSLHLFHDNNKIEYLTDYKFNICPENSNHNGYVTEKVFQAIYSGCIPIYYGSNNNPEPNILNHDAIIFWDKKTHGHKALAQVEDLLSDNKRLLEFSKQPRLLPSAEDTIEEMITNLYDKLLELITNSF